MASDTLNQTGFTGATYVQSLTVKEATSALSLYHKP